MTTEKTKKYKRVAYLFAVIFFIIVALYLCVRSSATLSAEVARQTAQFFVAQCKETTDSAGCYETAVPLLLHVTSVENVFSVIRQIRIQDQSYRFCHVLGHEVGVFAVRRDPENWMQLIHKNPPDSLCSNGYIHGVIIGKFNKAVLKPEEIDAIVPDLSGACEPSGGWNPTDLDKSMCYHGLGHVLTQITGPDIPLSVAYCKRIAVNGRENYSSVCISGVFMQIFQPLEPEDFALIEGLPVKPTKETLAEFCGMHKTHEERSMCFGEGWPLFREELNSASGIKKFCSTTPDVTTQENCYITVFSIGARASLFNPQKQEALCAEFSVKLHKRCLSILAEAFVEEDRTQIDAAVSVCRRAEGEFQTSCFSYLEILSDFTFGDDAKAKEALCLALPYTRREACLLQDWSGLERPDEHLL